MMIYHGTIRKNSSFQQIQDDAPLWGLARASGKNPKERKTNMSAEHTSHEFMLDFLANYVNFLERESCLLMKHILHQNHSLPKTLVCLKPQTPFEKVFWRPKAVLHKVFGGFCKTNWGNGRYI